MHSHKVESIGSAAVSAWLQPSFTCMAVQYLLQLEFLALLLTIGAPSQKPLVGPLAIDP